MSRLAHCTPSRISAMFSARSIDRSSSVPVLSAIDALRSCTCFSILIFDRERFRFGLAISVWPCARATWVPADRLGLCRQVILNGAAVKQDASYVVPQTGELWNGTGI